ncbi:Crp/Fnr family transcriptional regulator [Flavivirga aquimarina]|uniref:Crp/Fnr family transcriptional regulator n=1 Tax=Flavivirga aquimarina TaxID=2027862 RepID=A0ABT8W9H1_9FLAO|nr:Crp/Fnr family transcriptional regulator [Flavivirga aquimarina]MDO5969764.1 Crp/Fnr family transcriptional regulator [Flavivirga aquimarina]
MTQNKDSLIHFILSIVPIPLIEAQEIAQGFHPVRFKKGDFLLREKTISDDYLYLEKGLMRTFLFDLEGNEITIDFFLENNIVFEVTSFFNRVASEANIQAITDCIGFKISCEKLNMLFHQKPAFRDFGRAILVKEFMASKKRNYGMINKTAEQRYKELLATKPQILKHSPLKYIASYLGITDSTLSRLRRKT